MIRIHLHFVSAAAAISMLAVSACQTRSPGSQNTKTMSRSALEAELAKSREIISHYERKYGRLSPESQARVDFRSLRDRLPGKSQKYVSARLGKPSKVYSLGASESWEYSSAAYDSVAKRNVRVLQIWFRNGKVDYLNALY